jgi:ubiquinol-cytochrome c reductase cytochrome b subunit
MSFPWAKQYEPTNGVMQWLDERLPLPRLVYNAVGAGYPVPRNLSYMWNFGVLAGFFLVLQIVTGVVLAMHYAADATVAFGKVEHIMRDVNWGWAMRYAHANGASFFFIVVYLHIFRGFFYSSYKAPREMIWLLGVVIFLLMMATAFMGYVLPWGQMSFWGAKVITNLFSAIPFVGDSITTLLWGGYSVDNPTLNRFFSLHYLLPFVLAGLVALHIWALHVPGNNNPTGVSVKGSQDTVPFHPYYTMKDAFAIVVFFMFFALWLFFAPNYLGHAINYQEANPLVTPAHIVPEWYYLPFYAILRAVPDKLGGVIAMFASILILFALPWLDTSKVRSGNYRPLFKGFFWIFAAVCVGLGYLGSRPAEGLYVVFSQILTVYYFAHFLVILPLLGLLESPKPLPSSISDDVLAKQRPAAAAVPAE